MCTARRSLTLLVMLLIAGAVVAKPLHTAKVENRAKSTLLELQRALQEYHVDQERYVPQLELKGTQLISLLLDFGFLESAPMNPYTGQPYNSAEGEPDRIRYRTDEAFETYSLQFLHFSDEETWLEIDSVAHHSLE